MTNVLSSNLGYPRIGEKREWKKALESFWAGRIDKQTFLETIKSIRLEQLSKQKDKGIDLIPVGDFSLYDHVLDTAVMFGLTPERFSQNGEKPSLDTYFDIARGNNQSIASSMKKWFDTNYHYIVPEWEGKQPELLENRPLAFYREAKRELGIEGKPFILGPITFLKLSKGYDSDQFDELLNSFIPLYKQILKELEAEGVQWVQIDEPVLSTTLEAGDLERFNRVYNELRQAAPKIKIILQTYFESVDDYEAVVQLPVDAIGLDFVSDDGENLNLLRTHGFPENKILAAGVIDGRNVWRADLNQKLALLEDIQNYVPENRLIVQPSSSLLHVPVTVKNEPALSTHIKDALAFADEKLDEVTVLSTAINQGADAVKAALNNSVSAVQSIAESKDRNVETVQTKLNQLSAEEPGRKSNFTKRKQIQDDILGLPLLPTTSIGSLPQTGEVRKARRSWRTGEWSDNQYRSFIEEKISQWIEIQEDIGLDVLIHGEFERNDMVEYFGEKLGGFVTTKHGWVQSYGSRCVKPPLIYGDVYLKSPMTVEESVYAQSLTDKPVKGMLTGPQTILNWSFERDDVNVSTVQNQIALALRDEVKALEDHGIRIIQVDEPALREGLPLKARKWKSYLNAAVYAFKLSTTSVADETQIHTHMCYSEFGDIIDAINRLDADVIAIESSRSHGELIQVFEETGYDKGIGLGVYDIHSPRVPKLEEITQTVGRALKVLDPKLFWINPDCGLKTRQPEETINGLKQLVQAAETLRNEVYSIKQ